MKRLVLLFALLFAACSSRMTYVDIVPPGSGAAVRGVVTESSGSPLPGVTVNLAGRTTVTDAHGLYEFRGVAPGTYPLIVELSGFRREAMKILVVDGKILRLKTNLQIVSVNEAITVSAQAPMIGAAGGVVGGYVASAPPPSMAKSSFVAPPEPPKSTANYAPIAENGFIDAAKERTTTFSIDVDGASYANVRRFLNSNLIPAPDAVRIEEMINYFSYSYPQPNDGRPFSVTTDVAGCPRNTNHRLLRFGIQGKAIDQWKLA